MNLTHIIIREQLNLNVTDLDGFDDDRMLSFN
jgi:hypothetical protein